MVVVNLFTDERVLFGEVLKLDVEAWLMA